MVMGLHDPEEPDLSCTAGAAANPRMSHWFHSGLRPTALRAYPALCRGSFSPCRRKCGRMGCAHCIRPPPPRRALSSFRAAPYGAARLPRALSGLIFAVPAKMWADGLRPLYPPTAPRRARGGEPWGRDPPGRSSPWGRGRPGRMRSIHPSMICNGACHAALSAARGCVRLPPSPVMVSVGSATT